MPLLPAEADDFAHVVDETHVEHAVGLVEHQDRDLVQADMALGAEIEQAAWRRDQDVDSASQRIDLLPLADAAEDHGRAQLEVASIGVDALADLAGKLAGRRQDKRPRRARRPRLGLVEEKVVQERQGEGRCLTGARLGDAEQVLALEENGNRLHLNWRRRQILLGFECKPQRLGKAERIERRCHVLMFLGT